MDTTKQPKSRKQIAWKCTSDGDHWVLSDKKKCRYCLPVYEGEEVVKYQWREIGEGQDWIDCGKDWYEYCQKCPLRDTRIVRVKYEADKGI